MGFEIKVKYYEMSDNEEYDMENLHEKSILVGQPHEDIPLNILAARIFAQLARRKIYVHELEVFEFQKNKVSFKEVKDGILLKNRKFSFDGDNYFYESEPVSQSSNSTISTASIKEKYTEPKGIVQHKDELIKKLASPLRYEIYDPTNGTEAANFTKGNSYPIFAEKMTDRVVLYITVDNAGNEVIVNSKDFYLKPRLSHFS